MTNREAEAYMILAAKDIGLSMEIVKRLMDSLTWQMDVMIESEAVRAAERWLASSSDDP